MMNELLPSLITLTALLIPAAVFIRRIPRLNAASLVHAVLMAIICLFFGVLFSGALITLTGIQTAELISLLVVVGSVAATFARLQWLKRFD